MIALLCPVQRVVRTRTQTSPDDVATMLSTADGLWRVVIDCAGAAAFVARFLPLLLVSLLLWR